ncbi:MAG: substrate-binding domain-containing protein [Anaerolineae bacterium]|nr:substrate-binding domain-containing protein [Anaerolineae bacterium]
MNTKPNTSQTPQSSTARLTIGMLFENMPNEQQAYLSQVLAGVTSVAEKQDVNLLCFTGGHLYHTFYNQFDTQRNILYELVTNHTVDGLIILGTINTYAPMHKTLEFYQRYSQLPLVHIGLSLENIPTVVATETAGLYNAVVHLIQDHHLRRIAFINSPENRPTARPRYQAYVQALQDNDIAVDPDLVISGDWTVRAGREAVEVLLDQHKADVQAIVASNDNMALGALEALQERGIHVPYDMALTGFDDTLMSRLAIPSLTTVHQSMFELGAQGLTMLLAKITGKEMPLKVLLPTELIIRQSCGCPDPVVARANAVVPSEGDQAAGYILVSEREQIVAELAPLLGAMEEAAEWIEDLLTAYASDIDDESTGVFLSTLDKILREVIQNGGDLARWQDVISALRRRLHPHSSNPALCTRVDNLWHQARVFIGEAMRKAQAQHQMQADQQHIVMRISGQKLMTTFDFATLLDIIVECMTQLDIPACYLALYEDPQPYEYPQPAPEWSRLVLAYHTTESPSPGHDYEADTSERRFHSNLLLPPEMWPHDRRYTWIVEPLYFQNDQLGFAILEMGSAESPVYEILREQISSALKSVLLFQEQKRAEEALVQAYAHVEQQVRERTLELEQEINERRQAEAMQQILINELEAKNTELERFTYTVSHDLKSPLITISGFTGFLEQDMLTGDLEQAREDMTHINTAVARMQRLLDELLELSRIGRLMNPPEEVSFAEIAHEAVALAQGRIAAHGVQVDIVPDLPTVHGDRARLVEVVQNLVDNACKFMGDQSQRQIEIGARQDGNETVFYVRDNGIGIDPQYHHKVFGLFDKLDPQSEGTGVGLALVKRIIETHGGRIWVESQLGQGATFCLTLPSSSAWQDNVQ